MLRLYLVFVFLIFFVRDRQITSIWSNNHKNSRAGTFSGSIWRNLKILIREVSSNVCHSGFSFFSLKFIEKQLTRLYILQDMNKKNQILHIIIWSPNCRLELVPKLSLLLSGTCPSFQFWCVGYYFVSDIPKWSFWTNSQHNICSAFCLFLAWSNLNT